MKRFFSYILLAVFAIVGAATLNSCDKMDDNGPFDGYWLLTQVESPEGIVGTTPGQGAASDDADAPLLEKTITWGVRNELIQAHDNNELDFYYFTFTRTDKELQLNAAFHNDGSNDTPVKFDEIPAKFFIPADGHFVVKTLNSKAMVLQSNGLTLTFKKN